MAGVSAEDDGLAVLVTAFYYLIIRTDHSKNLQLSAQNQVFNQWWSVRQIFIVVLSEDGIARCDIGHCTMVILRNTPVFEKYGFNSPYTG